jgi:hypothetical protein
MRADRYGDRTMELFRFSLVLITLCASGPAIAQRIEDPEALIRQGIELRRQGDDVRAEGYFRRAYEIAHTPRSMAQLGLVELAIGDNMAAELYLTNALAGDDAWIQSYQKTLEDSRLSARGHLMQVVVTDAPPGTSAVVEKEPREELHLDGVLWLKPGSTIVVFEAAGYQPITMTIRGEPGTIQRIVVGFVHAGENGAALTEAHPTIQKDDASSRSRVGRRWTGVGIAIGVAGAAVGGVGTALLVTGNSKRDDIEAAANNDTKPYDPSDGNWRSLQREGIGLMIGGAVALAGGVTFILLGRHETTATDQISFAPAIGRGVGVVGRF